MGAAVSFGRGAPIWRGRAFRARGRGRAADPPGARVPGGPSGVEDRKVSGLADTATGNIAAALTKMARARPYATAIACPSRRDRYGRAAYTHMSFAALDRESDILTRGLAAVGVGRGARAAVLVKPGLEFFALTFALFKAGAVPVLIDPGIGLENLGRCLAEAAPL